MARRAKIDPEMITTIYEKRISGRFINRIKDHIDRESLRLITNISDDMRDRVGELLKQGEEDGKSVTAIASKLLTTGLDKGVFSSARKRAYLIAKTELHRARQRAAMDVYREADIRLLKWIGIPDDGRICRLCRERHGRTFRTADMSADDLPPIHPRCRCRLVPHDFDIKITPKRGRRGKIIETKISPTPKEYRYIVKVKPKKKVKKSLEKAVSYTRVRMGKLEHVKGYGSDVLKQELLDDKIVASKKVGVNPENLTYLGVQKTEGQKYLHLWNVDKPEHPQHMSTITGIERETKLETKEVRKGFIMEMKKSRKNLVSLRKSKGKGKLIPQNVDGKIRWTKAIGDDLWIFTKTKKADIGDTVLIKGQVAKVTAIGKDGLTARSLGGDKKYQILYEHVQLIKAVK